MAGLVGYTSSPTMSLEQLRRWCCRWKTSDN